MIKNKFVNNVGIMIVGSILTQLINVMIQPVLTRLLTTEELGLYNLILSIAITIIPISALKMEILIVTENSEKKALEIMDTAILSSIVIFFTTSIVTFSIYVIDIETMSEISFFLLFMPIMIFINCLKNIFNSYSNRHNRYMILTKANLYRETTKGFIQLIAAFSSLGVLGQLIGYILGPISGVKLEGLSFFERLKKKEFTPFAKIKQTLKENLLHIKLLVPSQLLNSLSFSIVLISINMLYGEKTLGFYSISISLLSLPLMVISTSVGRVFNEKFSKKYYSNESLLSLNFGVIFFLAAISITIFVPLSIYGPKIYSIIFGDIYIQSGEFVKYLSVMYIFRFIGSSMVGSLVILNKQSVELYINSSLVGIVILLTFLSDRFNYSINSFLLLLGSLQGAVYFVLIVIISSLVLKTNRKGDKNEHKRYAEK